MSEDDAVAPMPEHARRRDDDIPWAPFALAIVSAILLAIGALLLLDYTDPDARAAFAVRVVVGLGVAIVAVWGVATRHWLITAFAALLSAVTPTAEGWAWAQMLAIVLAVWALAKVWGDIVSGRNA